MLPRFSKLSLILCLALSDVVLGGPNDWVRIDYVLQQSRNPSSDTRDARQTIISRARQYSQKGPWKVTNGKDVLPPSGNAHDYLSWAPYHWPDCNWCPSGRTHLVHSGNDTSSDDGSDSTDPDSPPPSDGDISGPPGEDVDDNPNYLEGRRDLSYHRKRMNRVRRDSDAASVSVTASEVAGSSTLSLDTSMPTTATINADPGMADDPEAILTATVSTPTPSQTDSPTTTSSESTRTASFSRMPQAAAHTKAKAKCTPSPTKKMAPSATWTTCPYVVRDGKVNPDVRTLNGVKSINAVAETSIYLGITAVLQSSSDAASKFVSFINTFFLDPKTNMDANINFGQVVRGPGSSGRKGTFTGVLDLRGMVKIVNACMLLKAARHPDYTPSFDAAFTKWVRDYTNWLQSSAIGRKAATRPNNNGSFFVSQYAALLLFQGDTAGAKRALDSFFHQGPFRDQIAKNGDQPFESARTRPFHYRAFNLEALIVNAKLGAEIGVDYWSAQSKYGNTIQDAVNFAMRTKPGKEDVTELLPHVAAVRAVYGDPTGKYSKWIVAHDGKGGAAAQRSPFWFYDQPEAVGVRKGKRGLMVGREEGTIVAGDDGAVLARDDSAVGAPADELFECPDVFKLLNETEVEVDDGLFVTCDILKPYYELPALPDAGQ